AACAVHDSCWREKSFLPDWRPRRYCAPGATQPRRACAPLSLVAIVSCAPLPHLPDLLAIYSTLPLPVGAPRSRRQESASSILLFQRMLATSAASHLTSALCWQMARDLSPCR